MLQYLLSFGIVMAKELVEGNLLLLNVGAGLGNGQRMIGKSINNRF
jgi:hypothetical protein